MELDIGTKRIVHTEVMSRDVDTKTGSEVIVGQLGNQRVGVLDCKHVLTAKIACLCVSANAQGSEQSVTKLRCPDIPRGLDDPGHGKPRVTAQAGRIEAIHGSSDLIVRGE